MLLLGEQQSLRLINAIRKQAKKVQLITEGWIFIISEKIE